MPSVARKSPCPWCIPLISGSRPDAGMRWALESRYLPPMGEDRLVLGDAWASAANRQVAQVRKPAPTPEAPLPLERVATPGTSTIADLAAYLGVPTSRTVKAVFFVAMVA